MRVKCSKYEPAKYVDITEALYRDELIRRENNKKENEYRYNRTLCKKKLSVGDILYLFKEESVRLFQDSVQKIKGIKLIPPKTIKGLKPTRKKKPSAYLPDYYPDIVSEEYRKTARMHNLKKTERGSYTKAGYFPNDN